MVNKTKFVVKGGYSLKNNIGSRVLSDFLLIRTLRIIESAETFQIRSDRVSVYTGVRRLLGADMNRFGIIQTNNLVFSNFNLKLSPYKSISYKVGFNKLFWYNLINLSFFSHSLIFRKRYSNFPKKKCIIFSSRTWLKSNAQVDSYLTSNMNLKFIGSIPFILRNARSQFRNYELRQNLYERVAGLAKTVRVNNQFLPLFYNFFFTRFSGNLFYPYYEFRSLGVNSVFTEKIFSTPLFGFSYFFKKPLEFIVVHSEVLQKYYKLPVDSFFFFKNNAYIFLCILVYLYCTQKNTYFRLMQNCGSFALSGNSTLFMTGHSSGDEREFFETRVAAWEDDLFAENEVSKFFAANLVGVFPYFRKLARLWWIITWYSNVNYYNAFTKWQPRTSQFFLFKSGLYGAAIFTNKWTRFSWINYIDNSLIKPPIWVGKYYSYNNLVRPTFLFLFLLNYLARCIPNLNFKLFFGWFALGNFLYYFTPQIGRIFNLITINMISKINFEFFWKNWDYLYNIFRKFCVQAIIFGAYFKFVYNSLCFYLFSNKWNWRWLFFYAIFPVLISLIGITVYSVIWYPLGLFALLLLWILIRAIYTLRVGAGNSRVFDKRSWYFLFFRAKSISTDLSVLVYTLASFNLISFLFLNILWVVGFFTIILHKVKFIKLYLLQLKILCNSYGCGRFFMQQISLNSKILITNVLSLTIFYYFSSVVPKNSKIEFLWIVWVNPSIVQIVWLIKSYIYGIFANVGWWVSPTSFKFNISGYLLKYFMNYLYATVSVYGQSIAIVPARNFSSLWRLIVLIVELCWINGIFSYYEYVSIITWLGKFYKSNIFSAKFFRFTRDVIEGAGVGSYLTKFSYIAFRWQSLDAYTQKVNSTWMLRAVKEFRFFSLLVSCGWVLLGLIILTYNILMRGLQRLVLAFHHFYLLGK